MAAVLSLVIPGVGQFYNGDFWRGVFWLIITPGLWIGTGRLSRGQYTDMVAYLLQLNGMPAGQRRLSDDPKQLELIRLAMWLGR